MTYEQFNRQVGEFIKRNRFTQYITQQELSKATGISKTWIGQIERGQVNPTLKQLFSIWQVLLKSPPPFPHIPPPDNPE